MKDNFEYTDVNEMFPTSERFRVFVDGRELKVVADDEYDYVNITTKDIVDVRVEVNGEIEKIDLRPSRRQKKYVIDGNCVSFRMAYGDYYSFEVNGDLSHPLLLFCDEPIVAQKYTGKNLIYIKPGDYQKMDIITPESDTVIFIDEGAVLDGKINAKDVSRLRIVGNGYLFAKNILSGGKAHPINLNSCTDVEINGVTIVGHHTWNVRLWGCRDVLIQNVKIMSYDEWSDGIDVGCSENVVIRHVFVKNEDDCICIKTSMAQGGNYKGGDARNILVEDCVLWSGPRGNSLEIGYELNNGTVENVLFRNVDVIHRQTRGVKYHRTVIAMHHAGNSTIRNITYENIYAEETEENFIMLSHMHVPVWGLGNGTIENVRLRNVTLAGGELRPSFIRSRPHGLPEGEEHSCTLRNVTFENLTIHGEHINSVEKAKEYGFTVDDGVENLKFV